MRYRTGLKVTISGPFFIGVVVGVGWLVTGVGRRSGTLLGTLPPMPMCALQAHVVLFSTQ
jgi:hypothetical protein